MSGQKSLQYFVRFLGETMTSYICFEINWPLVNNLFLATHLPFHDSLQILVRKIRKSWSRRRSCSGMKIEIFFKIKVNKPSKFREIKEALHKWQLVPRTDWQDHIFSISHENRGNLNIFSKKLFLVYKLPKSNFVFFVFCFMFYFLSKFREIEEALQKRQSQLVPRSTHWSNLNTFSGMESAFFSEISFRTVYLFQAKLYWLKCVVTWQVQNQSNLLSTKYGEISSKLRTKSFLLSSDLSKAWSRDKFLTN